MTQSVIAEASGVDSDGSIAAIEFRVGTDSWIAVTSPPYRRDFGTLSPGTHTISARARDNDGGYSTPGVIDIRVNAPPSVNLSSPTQAQVINLGQTVTARASASDSDGTLAGVEFRLDNGSWNLDSATQYSYSYNGLSVGEHRVDARSLDDDGAYSAIASRTFRMNALPTLAVSEPTNNAVYEAGQDVIARATANDTDGNIAAVEFRLGSGAWISDTSPAYERDYGALAAGNYTIYIRARDNDGAYTETVSRDIHVNAAPTISVSAPENNTVFDAGNRIVVDASANDSDGDIQAVEFRLGTGVWISDMQFPYSHDFGVLAAGNYELSVRSRDDNGTFSVISSINIKVNALPTLSVSAPETNAIYTPSQSVVATASASDSDGSVTAVEFRLDSGAWVPVTEIPYSRDFGALSVGDHIVSIRARDNDGAYTGTVSRDIRVNAAPTISVSAPANNAVFDETQPVVASASATDSGGSIAAVEFSLDGGAWAIDAQEPYSNDFGRLSAGAHTISYRARDNDGTYSSTVDRVIRVNAAPAVAVSNPANNTVYAVGQSVSTEATATDSDGTVAAVEFKLDEGPWVADIESPYTRNYGALAAGTYRISYRSRDNDGAYSPEVTRDIVVNAAPTLTVSSPTADTVYRIEDAVIANANAEDSDGSISAVEFRINSGAWIVDDDVPYSHDFGAQAEGSHTISYRAKDNHGAYSAIDTRTVTVSSLVASWSQKDGTVGDVALANPTVPSSNFNGVMAGSGGVSGGAASYSIPISMPPGRAGIQPSVSIDYSSRSGNGTAGVGWSLNAGGAISRCPATQAQDGFTSGIWFKNETDRLCMNGQRLVAESGAYGANGTIYRTEIDSFAQVTQLGGGLESAAAYFEVEYANGEKSTYGKAASRRVSPTGTTQTLSWLMERMEDASGNNHMSYEYTDEGDGELLLSAIRYTGDGTTDGDRSVVFTYENRTKFSTSYIAGAYTRQTKRLKTVTSRFGTLSVWQYTLNYAASKASNRSLLQSVQECGFLQGRGCRQAATFDWLDSEPTYQVEPLSTSDGRQLVSRNHLNQMRDSWEVTARGDADGNGSRDWPEYYTNAEGDNLGVNTTEMDTCSRNRITGQPTCFAADFNFDGRTDSWRFTNVGTSYVLQLSHANNNGTLSWFSSGVEFPNGDREVEALTSIADYTGDGWPDIVIHQGFDGPESGFNGTLWLYPHSRGAVPYSNNTRISLMRTNEHDSFQFIGDMNADGLPDIIRSRLIANTPVSATPAMQDLLLTKVTPVASGVSVELESHNINFNEGLLHQEGREQFAMLIDVNGDGLQDWVGWIVGGQGKLHIKLNKGDGTFTAAVNTDITLPTRTLYLPPEEGIGGLGSLAQGQTQSPRFSEALKPMDIDGDGRAELIMPGNAASDIVSEACWTHPSWTGTRFVDLTKCGQDVYDTYNSNANLAVRIENAPASWDHNIYKYKAIRFTEDAEGVITAAVENTDLIGAATHSSVQDAFGKGLADLVFTFGCTSDHCSIADNNLQNDSDLPVNHYLFNRNYGSAEDATLNKDSYRPIDMMVKVTNGAGLESQWTYHPLSSDQVAGYYDADYSIIDGEHFNFASTMYNVSQFEQSNGVGGTNTMSYQYRGAMYNAFGRGFRGFRAIIEIDDTRGTHTQTDFKQVFPYSSLIERQRRYHGAQILSDVQNTWALNTSHDIDGVVNVFNSSSTTTQYDLNNGLEVGSSSSTIAQADVDAYGNVEKQTQTTTDEYGTITTVTTTEFDPGDTPSLWWPHRQTSTTVARSISHTAENPARHATATVNKTITTNIAKWNDTHRQPEVVTIAPGAAALTAAQCNADSPILNACQTTETTYNTHGLPTEVKVTGTKITGDTDTPVKETRTTSTQYTRQGSASSEDGYFPSRITQTTGVGTRTLLERRSIEGRIGLPTLIIDASGSRTSTQYDAVGRVRNTQTTGFPRQFTRYRTPDSNAPSRLGADAIMMVEIYQAGTPVSAEYIDRLGRSIRTRSQDFGGANVYTDTRYDNLGRMTHESNRHYGTPVYTTYDSYDVLDRPLSKTTRATQSGEDVETTYVHDVLETTITTQAPDGADLILKRSYSTQGQLMSTTDAIGGITSYAYDAAGNPIVIKDAVGNSIYANYDDLGRKEWVIDPNQGRTDFVYNDFGDLDKETDANSDTIRYEHDHVGRVLSRFGDNQEPATFLWDTLRPGLMTRESADGVIKSYAYDSASRPTTVTTTIDGTAYAVTTRYDANYGRPKAMVYPNDLTVKLEYNSVGYLNKESNAQSGYVYREITAQDAWGNISSAKLTDGLLTSTMLYSARTNQMLSSRVRQGGVDKHYLNYSNYDSYGNIITQQNLANGVNATETFTYDELHRLTQSSLSGNGFTSIIDYGFDGVGNLLKKTDYSADEANAYQYATGTNRLSTVKLKDNSMASFGYDAKGNLTKRNNATENTYNVFNKPTRIQRLGSTVNLNYGADLARYKQVRTVNGQTITTHYIGKVFEIEATGSGASTTIKETTYIDDVALLIEEKDSTGELTDTQIRFGHQDRLGSTATFTDHNGQVTTLRSYDPFGAPKGGDWSPLLNLGLSARLNNNPTDGDVPTRRGYTDHEHLDEVEIIHMNGRVYDYNVGRFMSVDPFIVEPTNSQAVNPYSYVMNNPLGFTDPSGYSAKEVENQEFTIEVENSGSRLKSEVTVSVGGSGIHLSGGNGAAQLTVKSAITGSLISSGFTATDAGSQSSVAVTEAGGGGKVTREGGTGNENSRHKDATYVELAECVYPGNGCFGANGFTEVFGEQLEVFGIDASDFENDAIGFNAKLYYNADKKEYVLSFAGSDELKDVLQYGHSFGKESKQLNRAIRLATNISDAINLANRRNLPRRGNSLTFVGHSLGGGLATGAALVTDRPAITFNSQGLTVGALAGYGVNLDGADDLIKSYYTLGDFLGPLQSQTAPALGERIKVGYGWHGIKNVCRAMGTSC
ncbi:hypothetical protein EYS14_22905 [Alteromonadaceae bacterium M269]|nr:hypothetical protein EYS14_22905 [Alteromonadaceae bacterium M269]